MYYMYKTQPLSMVISLVFLTPHSLCIPLYLSISSLLAVRGIRIWGIVAGTSSSRRYVVSCWASLHRSTSILCAGSRVWIVREIIVLLTGCQDVRGCGCGALVFVIHIMIVYAALECRKRFRCCWRSCFLRSCWWHLIHWILNKYTCM